MNAIEQMHQHRSIRRYKPDPVSEDVLNEILEAGIRASSSGNMQSYSLIVTRDPDLKQELLEPHLQQRMVVEAPVLITFCADFNRMRRWLALSEAPANFDNFFSFLVGAIDAVLVSQNVALAAESRGLGICYLGSTLSSCDRIAEILKLPEQVMPVTGFVLGYPDQDPDLRYRLPREGLVHQETYQTYSDQDIAAIYSEKETRGWERYLKSPRLRKLVEESGVENLAQMYTVVKYTRKGYQGHSQNVLRTLEEKGFMKNGLNRDAPSEQGL